MSDMNSIIASLQERNRILDEGTIDELIAFAKEFDITQESTSKAYDDVVAKVKARLTSANIDWKTL